GDFGWFWSLSQRHETLQPSKLALGRLRSRYVVDREMVVLLLDAKITEAKRGILDRGQQAEVNGNTMQELEPGSGIENHLASRSRSSEKRRVRMPEYEYRHLFIRLENVPRRFQIRLIGIQIRGCSVTRQ